VLQKHHAANSPSDEGRGDDAFRGLTRKSIQPAGGGGALTAMSAASAGVPINAATIDKQSKLLIMKRPCISGGL
jgi:hypothetical protein